MALPKGFSDWPVLVLMNSRANEYLLFKMAICNGEMFWLAVP